MQCAKNKNAYMRLLANVWLSVGSKGMGGWNHNGSIVSFLAVTGSDIMLPVSC